MPRKQEQESAREEVTEVGRNVLRMELPIHMPGLGHVNCYALIDGDGATVVDPGMPTPGSFAALKQRLKTAGLSVRNIHTVVVTHSHPDHFGGAGRIARQSGAKIIAHESFRLGPPPAAHSEVSAEDLPGETHSHTHVSGVSGDEPTEKGSSTPKARRRDMWGGPTPWGGERPRPPLKMRMVWRARQLLRMTSVFPPVSDPVTAGDVVRLAGREWFIVHTPGHTEDHICLHDPAEGTFLAGDHVLPTITPHISGLSTYKDPLAAFFDSLDQVAAIPDVSQVLPAHGHPFEDLAARCSDIKIHHDGRLARLKEIAREIGPNTVEAFMKKLFRERSWGGMAESETYAHLEHLRIVGNAECHRGSTGNLIYEL